MEDLLKLALKVIISGQVIIFLLIGIPVVWLNVHIMKRIIKDMRGE